MPTIPRALDDLLLDAIAAKVVAFRDREAAIDPGVTFDIDIERNTPWSTEKPLVNLLVTADDFDASGSSTKTSRAGKLTVKAQLWAPVDPSRLRYLKAQVIAALYALSTPDFGEELGDINLGWPSYSLIDLSDIDLFADMFAGEWKWEVGYQWTPEDIATPTPLASVSVNAARWAATYNFGG